MSALEALAIVGVGLVAGTINTIVGSGSLITFPTLLAFGFTPIVANVSNTIGLVPGSLSGAVAYRSELRGQKPRLVVLGAASVAGGVAGAVLLLALPGSVFRHVVPVLILIACVLVALQPRLSARLAQRHDRPTHGGPVLFGSVFLTGVYGGYFGAAQGVILLSLLGIFLNDHLQKLNATKNVLAFLVNGVAGILFIAFAHVSWEAAGLLAVGSVVGGQVGGAIGRRLPAPLLRSVIVVVGVIAAIALLV
ncbi:MAG TPA: sulfite exporter TauE/SafE family protein [Acidimicrobiales bacterium]